ncbi:MAG: hypothetical protein JW944_11830 [Deltaproteobacteria bacterium]|nr:hypothetical protein [Deltaproteobacteria bacterium]
MIDKQVKAREVTDWLRVGRGSSLQAITPRRIEQVRSAMDFFRRILFAFVLADLPLGLSITGLAARLSCRAGIFGLFPDEIHRFLGDVPGMDYARISRDVAASAAKNMMLRSFVRYKGLEGLAPFIRISGQEYLCSLHEKGRPAVLVFGHNGPVLGILAALYRLNLPVLVMRKESPVPYPVPPGFDYCFMKGGLKNRTMALKLSIDRLRSGGIVLLALWGKGGSGKDAIEFMGRNVSFGPGFAVASRVSQAPVIPVSSGWIKGRKFMGIHFHDPLKRPDCPHDEGANFDRMLIKEAAQWLEREIRAMPGQIQINQLRSILGAYG